jgi:AcrR family transcriptional regulator
VSPRAGLTSAVVVAAAGQEADARGVNGLTLAAVAARLGVRPPSLFSHVEGLDDLRDRVAVRAVEDLGAALRDAAVGRSGEDGVRALADAYRSWALDHPGRYAATQRAPDPSDEAYVAAAQSAVDVVVAVLSGLGLAGDDAVHATRVLRSALHGFVSLEINDGFKLALDRDESFRRLVDVVITGLLIASRPVRSGRSRRTGTRVD